MTDPTERFSSRVGAYTRFRPGYPAALVPTLEKEAALRPGSTIADLGAGTGKSCEPFLLAGYSVVAVEPNAAMRQALDEALGDFASWRSVDGRAEATGLDDASVDAVFAGQAFHWFEPKATKREVSRILKPGGLCVLAWNERDLAASHVRARLRRGPHATLPRVRHRTEAPRPRRRHARRVLRAGAPSPHPARAGPGPRRGGADRPRDVELVRAAGRTRARCTDRRPRRTLPQARDRRDGRAPLRDPRALRTLGVVALGHPTSIRTP